MLYVCKPEYCSENEHFSDILKAPKICMISGVISFGKPFGNLCSKKHRFMEENCLMTLIIC